MVRAGWEPVRFPMSIHIHILRLLTVFLCNSEDFRDCAYVYTYRICQLIIPTDFQILYSGSCSGLSQSFKNIPNRQPLDLFFQQV